MGDYKKAYIAGGCFWGMEDLFRVRPGIKDTEVGYQGGENDNPTYKNHPGHAEGIELTYDSSETSFKEIFDESQKDTDYREKVKSYTKYLIGRKISKNTAKYS